jgi:hypothetical protein
MSLLVTEAYDRIEKIITYGFLFAKISYGDHTFLLKNITDKEYSNVELYKNSNSKIADVLYHLSFCTVLVDSRNFLCDRFLRIPELVDFYSTAPVSFVLKIKNAVQELNRMYLEALSYLEGFCYTDRSHHLWQVLDLSSRGNFTGIAGIDNVGLNSVQENWRIINSRMDEEQEYQRELSLSLLVASSMNPKGTKVISNNFDASKKELEELREEIAKYGYDKKRVEDQKKQDLWTAPLKSREDLVRELYRQMEGKKDKHDLFIDQWVAAQKAKAVEAQRQAEARQREFREKLSEADISTFEGSRPVSKVELEKILNQQRSGSPNVHTEKYMSAYEGDDKNARFIKKISTRILRAVDKE